MLQHEDTLPPTSLEDAIAQYIRRYFCAHGESMPPAGMYDRILPLMERPLITEVLRVTGGNQLKAAALLGLNRNTLRKKIRMLGVVPVTGGR